MDDVGVRELRDLPKAHLHVHVSGSLRAATYLELAERAGVAPTSFTGGYASWAAFVAAYRSIKPLIATPDVLHRVVVELLEDDAASGAVWTELSISPTGAYRGLTGSDTATLELVCDAVATAGRHAGVVVAADRDRDAEDPEAVARLAAAWAGRGVVGFGLAGDETASCRPFGRAAAIAHDAGLQVVPHAGETVGAASMRDALDVLRPDRVMHGVRAVEDPALVSELADRGIGLDVCPSSNVALGVVDELSDHPLPQLLHAGVACSLNADDTLVFGTDLAREYQQARDVLGLTDAELAAVARFSLRTSSAPAATVSDALGGIEAWWSARPDPSAP